MGRGVAPAAGPTPPTEPTQSIVLDLAEPGGGGYARPVADVVFVIDTTGSMDDKIDGLLQACSSFARRLAAKDVDWRVAIVAFGDLRVEGDRIVATGYMDHVENVQASLRRVPRFSGGANRGESSLDALDRAIGLPSRHDATRVFLLITDEGPHQHGDLTAKAMADRLRTERIVTFTVAPDMKAYKNVASVTGGEWFEIREGVDFSSILSMFDAVAATIAVTVSAIAIDAGGDVERYLLGSGRRRR